MTNPSPELLGAILRTDLPGFIEKCFRTLNPGKEYITAWYIDYLAYELRECAKGKRLRLIVSLPPRSGKSTIISGEGSSQLDLA